jgi:hypothetical protein
MTKQTDCKAIQPTKIVPYGITKKRTSRLKAFMANKLQNTMKVVD